MAVFFGTKGPGESETLTGTAGNDTFDHLGGSDLILGGLGNDTLVFFDAIGNFQFQTLSGVTRILGSATASEAYMDQMVTVTSVEKVAFSDATLTLATTTQNPVFGTKGAGESEAISGTANDDVIDHKGGNDTINGGGGVDTLLFFDDIENFDVTVVGGVVRVLGKNTAAAEYADQLVLAAGVEKLQFLNQSMVIPVEEEPNLIGASSTVAEVLIGSSGNDVFDHRGGPDRVDGRNGNDTIVFFDYLANFTVRTLAGVTHVLGKSTAATPYKDFEVVLTSVESIKFLDATLPLVTTSNNVVFGTSSTTPEIVVGTNTNDIIDHLGGPDAIDGGSGSDTVLFFDSRENFVVTTLGSITQVVGKPSAALPYRNVMATLQNVEFLLFSDETVTPTSTIITGTTESDYLTGTLGNDIIDPRGGSDFIDGGAGIDTVLINDNLNSFEFWTLLGVTWMWGNNNEATEPYKEFISILRNIENVRFLDGTVTLAPVNNTVIFGATSEGVEYIVGTAGDDIIDHVAGSDFINGGNGYDTVLFFGHMNEFVVTSLAGRFWVYGKDLGGNIDFPYEETLATLDNVERLLFLDGQITLNDDLQQLHKDILGTSNTGSEFIVGTEGNNRIDHLGGADRIDGGGGIDTLLFFDVRTNYTVTTLAGVTHVLGKSSAATVYRDQEVILANVEFLLFVDGALPLDTTQANVELGLSYGSSTSETIYGTTGNDIIDHLGGSDTIYGGGGFDTVLFFDSKEYYTVTALGGRARVVGNEGASSPYRGVEVVLDSVESLQFLDGTIILDGSGGPIENDVFVNSDVSETFNGGNGIDTVIYGGPSTNYLLTRTFSGYTVKRGLVEIDTLLDIERLEFVNKKLAIDLDNGDSAANTVRMLGASFGGSSVNDEVLVGIGLNFFDSGWTMKQVADLIVGLDSFRQLSNRSFAQTLCSNIGFAATTADLNFFQQILDIGVERGDLLRAAAEYHTNDQSINLVGLRQTGVEFVEYVV